MLHNLFYFLLFFSLIYHFLVEYAFHNQRTKIQTPTHSDKASCLRFLLKFVDIFSIINTNHVSVHKLCLKFKVCVIFVYSTKIRICL